MENQEQTVKKFYQILIDSSKDIGPRYQAVFQLKNIATKEAIKKLMDAYQFCQGSVLLKHQLLYALGQFDSKNVNIQQFKQFLIEKVQNQKQNNLSRHQAAQALANYFLPQLQQLYTKHLKSQCKQLKWTCQIALQKIKAKNLKQRYGLQYYGTKQPAAAFTDQQFMEFLQNNKLKQQYEVKGYLSLFLNDKISLFHKYRIMYLMRNKKELSCIQALCKLLTKQCFKSQTSLLKHEICFVLGQIGCGKYQNLVRQCIQNDQQEQIVRHEALAAVASQSKDEKYLQKFVNHQNRLIRQSAQVAQFTIKYWHD